ncbi:Aldose 1-epimerase [Planctomycetes bacterium MalM25]|nr:Aldose 1-epimerase [Planctomycetes bacterium MalM25]
MPEKTVRLTHAASGATADVALGLGFNCYSWRTTFAGESGGEPRELLWAEPGFEACDGRPSRSGTPLLAPFAGRIKDARFEWDGVAYDLEDTSGAGHAIHGFAVREAWREVSRADDRVTAQFQPSIDAPEALPQWPCDYRLEATYTLEAHRLRLELSAENLGEIRMPFAFGSHAYFRLPLAEGGDPEATVIRAPIDGEWVSNEAIPTGELAPLANGETLPAGGPLGGREFDTPYRFASGASTTEVSDPNSGRRVVQTFDDSMKCCVIYTPEHREAICLEPYTGTPDAIAMTARGVEAGLITLGPGETYRTVIDLEALTA